MGRSANSLGKKLGVLYDWRFSSLVENNSLKPHYFLEYIESLFEMEEFSSFILSHVNITNKYDQIVLDVFIYDNFIEEDLDLINVSSLHYIGLIRKGILSNLSKVLVKEGKRFFGKNIKIVYYVLDEDCITADFLANYVGRRLKSGRSFMEIVNKVGSSLKMLLEKEENSFMGCKIIAKGRLGKRSRASVDKYKLGQVSLGTIYNLVDYSKKVVILRYGTCCIKVWVVKRSDRNSYKYKIEL